MPVKVTVDGGEMIFIYPTMNWKVMRGNGELKVDENFYITTKAISK